MMKPVLNKHTVINEGLTDALWNEESTHDAGTDFNRVTAPLSYQDELWAMLSYDDEMDDVETDDDSDDFDVYL